MKFAALGWYGHNNEGDERIGYSLKKYFESQGHTLELIDPFSKDFAKVNSFDFIFYGGGGLIHRGFNKCTYILDQIRKPMGFVGISVEASDHTNNIFIQKMLEKAHFVYVRDKRSAKLLKYHPKVIQSEDLSFLYPWNIELKENPSPEQVGLNLRSWQFWQMPFASGLDKKLRALYRRKPQVYRILTKIPFSKKTYQPRRIVQILKSRFSNLKAISFYDDEVKPEVFPASGNDQYILREAGLDTGFFNVEDIQKSDLVVAMRLHCVIYCIQMGIPCVSLNYEPKNQGLLQNLGLEEIGLSVFEANETNLNQKINFVVENYEEIRSKFLAYRQHAHDDVRKVMDQILDLVLERVGE